MSVLTLAFFTAPWHDLPGRYPPYQTCHRRFQHWQRTGMLPRLLRRLAEDLRDRGKLDLTEAFIDASFSSAKKGALPSVLLAAVRGARSWRSATAMVFLSPCTASASPGETTLVDATLAQRFLRALPTRLIGDRRYDSDPLDRHLCDQFGIELISPNRSNRRTRTQ